MIVYESTKAEFLNDVFEDQLVNNICSNYRNKIGKVNESEVRSWDNSMQYMYRVLSDAEIPENSGVAIEFKIPYTSRRVDFIITGIDENQSQSIVVVELKQWSKVEKVDNKEAIVKTFLNKGLVETTHPSYQAWSYASLIKDYNENVQNEEMNLYPCAYIHNYLKQENDDPLTDKIYEYYLEKSPVFLKGDSRKLRDFIKRNIKFGDNKEILYKIENGRIRPSKSLQDSLSNMLKGNQEFIMIDNQKVVYETALELANTALRTNTKQVLIVEGGPGTGKSVLAVNLLVETTKRQLVSQYVTKNAAPRNVYSTKLSNDFRKGQISNLFTGSGSYIETPKDEFDVLIVDEAHRLNKKSGMFCNLGENQIKEIINASKCAVFFIDENQRVTLKDSGTIGEIQKFASEFGAKLTITKLDSQFRCNGSDGYLSWVDDVLQIRETANSNYYGTDYDFRVFTDPNLMFQEIRQLNKKNNKARMVAGYCWNWIAAGKSKSNVHDIIIQEHNFSASWNLGNSSTWAIDETSVSEIGCIHTSQGLEFDYVGVIIGDDLFSEFGEIKTNFNKRASTDSSLKGIKTLYKADPEKALKEADEIIKNTYRTLMTRGQKGCFIYCTDKELEKYFLSRINQIRHEYVRNEFFVSNELVAEERVKYEV